MTSQMAREYREAPERIAALLRAHRQPFEELAIELQRREPAFVCTIARGSSDQAASYAAHLFAVINGRATSSLQPSLATLYQARLQLHQAFSLTISQSGASPDLAAMTKSAQSAGALTACLVNQSGSATSAGASHILPQAAGPETSVAATKTVLCSMAACAWLSALWAEDQDLLHSLTILPEHLARITAAKACRFDISGQTAFVIGRGPGLAAASEIALKLKETAGQTAQAYSPAEFHHGPKAALKPGTPLVFIETPDAGGASTKQLRLALQQAGYTCHTIAPPNLHPALNAITALAMAYPRIEGLARARGLDPDRPQGLRKVTKTV